MADSKPNEVELTSINSDVPPRQDHLDAASYHTHFEVEEMKRPPRTDRKHSHGGYIYDGGADLLKSYWTSLKKTTSNVINDTPRDFVDECRYLISHPRITVNELLAGISMSVIVLPESISFAYLAGFPPIAGMHATFFLCFFCAILGAQPAMISGCAGSMCAILQALTADSGPLGDLTLEHRREATLMTIFFVGIVQYLCSWLRLSQYTRLLPQSTLIGFVNGLAIVIFMSQMPAFQKCVAPDADQYPFGECADADLKFLTFAETELWFILLIFVSCALIIQLFPKVPVVGKYVPSTFIALLFGTVLEHAIIRPAGFSTRTLEQTAPLAGGWPTWSFPQVFGGSSTWGQIMIYSVYNAAVGIIESIMTVQAMGEMLGTKVSNEMVNRETFAQGSANLISSVFGAIGGNGMIGESNLNLISGSRHRLSAIVCAWCVLFIVVWLSPVVNLVPVACLAAVILCITVHTFYWPTLWTLHRMRKHDAIIVIVVTVLAVVTNLVIAMAVGFVIAAINNVLDGYNSFSIKSHDLPFKGDHDDFFYAFHLPKTDDDADDDADDAGTPVSSTTSAPSSRDSLLLPLQPTASTASPSAGAVTAAASAGAKTCTASAASAFAGAPASTPADHGDVNISMSAEPAAAGSPASPTPAPDADADADADNSPSMPDLATTAEVDQRAGSRDWVRVYKPSGLVFFGSSRYIKNFFVPEQDPVYIVLDMADSILSDLSATSALIYVVDKYREKGRFVKMVNVDRKSRKELMRNSFIKSRLSRIGDGEYRCRGDEEMQERREARGAWYNPQRYLRRRRGGGGAAEGAEVEDDGEEECSGAGGDEDKDYSNDGDEQRLRPAREGKSATAPAPAPVVPQQQPRGSTSTSASPTAPAPGVLTVEQAEEGYTAAERARMQQQQQQQRESHSASDDDEGTDQQQLRHRSHGTSSSKPASQPVVAGGESSKRISQLDMMVPELSHSRSDDHDEEE